jgi:hypothetical protein
LTVPATVIATFVAACDDGRVGDADALAECTCCVGDRAAADRSRGAGEVDVDLAGVVGVRDDQHARDRRAVPCRRLSRERPELVLRRRRGPGRASEGQRFWQRVA